MAGLRAVFWRRTQEALRRRPVELDEDPVWELTALTVSEVRRGQIWLADFGVPVGHEQGKVRPALVVSADSWNGHASTVTVLPITRSSRDFPTRIEVEATAGSGLDVTSYARCEDIRAISERRLLRALGRVDPLVMLSVSRILRLFLDT